MKKNLFDDIDEREMDKLLKDLDPDDYKIDPKVRDRIYGKFLEGKRELDKENKKPWYRKGLIAAAAVLLAFSIYQIPAVQATVNKLFSFIPGIGAVEETDKKLLVGKLSVIEDPDNKLISFSDAISKGESIEFRIKIKEQNIKIEEENSGLSELKDYQLFIKDKQVMSEPMGMISKSDSETFNFLSYSTEIKEGDKVKLINGRHNFKLEGKIHVADVNKPGDLPSASNDGVSVFASVLKGEKDWEISLYSLSDTKDVISFSKDLPYTEDGYLFETESGNYRAKLPTSWGSAYIPPLTLKIPETVKKGTLVLPYVEYETKDSADVTVELPKVGAEVDTDIKVKLGESGITITKIYTDKDNGVPALQFKVDQTEHRITGFSLEKASGMSFDPNAGEGAILLIDQKGMEGTFKFKIVRPIFRIQKEFRIQLDL